MTDGFVIAVWDRNDLRQEGERTQTLQDMVGWMPFDYPSLGAEDWLRLHDCMARFITHGSITEVLEVNYYSPDTAKISQRLSWWTKQLKLRDAEQGREESHTTTTEG